MLVVDWKIGSQQTHWLTAWQPGRPCFKKLLYTLSNPVLGLHSYMLYRLLALHRYFVKYCVYMHSLSLEWTLIDSMICLNLAQHAQVQMIQWCGPWEPNMEMIFLRFTWNVCQATKTELRCSRKRLRATPAAPPGKPRTDHVVHVAHNQLIGSLALCETSISTDSHRYH